MIEEVKLQSGNTDFCYECRKDTKYILEQKNYHYTHNHKMYSFPITIAICTACGMQMNPPGLADLNVNEFEAWFESKFNIELNK